MRAVVGKDICRDLGQAMVSEWLDTNGCGGFASSTIAGMNTRRYHSLLIASLDAPVGRVAYLSSIQETATVGSHSLELGCNVYHDVVHPRGYRYLEHVQVEPYPIFTYRIEGVSLEKHVMMLSGRNATVISYRSTGPIDLILRPLLSLRDFHNLSRYNGVADGTSAETGPLSYPMMACRASISTCLSPPTGLTRSGITTSPIPSRPTGGSIASKTFSHRDNGTVTWRRNHRSRSLPASGTQCPPTKRFTWPKAKSEIESGISKR